MIRVITESFANEGRSEVGITLVVGGVIITGNITGSNVTLLEKFKHLFQRTVPSSKESAEILRTLSDVFEKQLEVLSLGNLRPPEPDEEELDPNERTFVIYDAAIISDGKRIPENGTIMEVRTSSVDVWMLGKLSG